MSQIRPVAAKHSAFTIVELLIIIVVIGILAAITLVSYNGVQLRGQDSARRVDAAQFKKLVELKNAEGTTYLCATCNSSALLASAYKATSIIPSGAQVYMWSAIWNNTPTFDKKKLVIIQDDMNYQWILVSYWSNASQSWITRQYYDYNDGNPFQLDTTGSAPLPPD